MPFHIATRNTRLQALLGIIPKHFDGRSCHTATAPSTTRQDVNETTVEKLLCHYDAIQLAAAERN